MDVDDAVGVGGDEGGGEDLHIARQHHQFDSMVGQGRQHLGFLVDLATRLGPDR